MIDTLSYTKNLQKAGFSEKQAEIIVKANLGMLSQNVATKTDLKELEYTLRNEIRGFESRLRDHEKRFSSINQKLSEHDHRFDKLSVEIRALKSEMVNKLGGIVVGSATLLGVVIKFF